MRNLGGLDFTTTFRIQGCLTLGPIRLKSITLASAIFANRPMATSSARTGPNATYAVSVDQATLFALGGMAAPALKVCADFARHVRRRWRETKSIPQEAIA